MEWRNTLIGNDTPVFYCSTAGDTSANREKEHALWCIDKKSSSTVRIVITDDGKIKSMEHAYDHPYGSILSHDAGYLCVHHQDKSAILTGYTHNHEKVWEYTVEDGEPLKWSMAPCQDGKLYLLYSIKASERRAHVICIDKFAQDRLRHVFTVPDIDLFDSRVIVAMKDNLAICTRNHGNQVVSYLLDKEGHLLSRSAFSDHRQSKAAVPLCASPTGNGTFILGGYREDIPGKQRVPWLCLFDEDMTPLHDAHLSGTNLEQAIKALVVQEDGSLLALSTPWTIYRISPKGFVTHSWNMPVELHCNTLTSIKPIAGMQCLLTGNVYSEHNGTLLPGVWLGKINEDDFVPVTDR